MEATDNNQLIIGQYLISKTILMSEPCQLYVTNTETNECKLYRIDEVFKLLKKESHDVEPLHEYFDEMNGTTKEERLEILKMFEDWEEAKNEDRKQLNRLEKWEAIREERKQMEKDKC